MKNNARPFRRIVSILFFSVVAGFGLSAEVQISLTPPGLMPGLTGLEDMFEDEVVALTDEINETLSDSIDKPLFMQGFGGAAATSVLVPHAVRSSSVPSVHFGIDVSVYAEPLASDIAIRLKNLDADSDERMGACMQPFVVSVRVPLDRFYPGLYGGGNFGYMNTLSGDYRMRAIAAGLSAGYRLKGSRFGVFFWDGISVEAGADYSSDRITASFSPGSVSETITLDEDGDGPLPAFDAALTFDPEVTAGVDLSVLSFSIQASSGVTVIEAVSLFAGVGLTVAASKVGITVKGNSEIETEGHFAELVEEPGRITVSGTIAEERKVVAGLFFEGGMQFRAGALLITFPVVWRPYRSLGTGIFMGVTF